jgi:hypothetical protein
MIVAFCNVNRLVCVPVIAADATPLVFALCVAANGLVGGLNVEVYTATPFTIRALLMYPVNGYNGTRYDPSHPIDGPEVSEKLVVLPVTGVASETPFKKSLNVPLLLLAAT